MASLMNSITHLKEKIVALLKLFQKTREDLLPTPLVGPAFLFHKKYRSRHYNVGGGAPQANAPEEQRYKTAQKNCGHLNPTSCEEYNLRPSRVSPRNARSL